MLTLAPEMPPPLASVTLPTMVPKATCAQALGANSARRETRVETSRSFAKRSFMEPLLFRSRVTTRGPGKSDISELYARGGGLSRKIFSANNGRGRDQVQDVKVLGHE